MSDIIAYKIGEQIIDTQSINGREGEAAPIYFDNSADALNVIRHSCAHLMAQAIKSIYPQAKFFVGPNVEDGFYYDFKVDEANTKLSDDDLVEIEKKTKELSEAKLEIVKTISTKAIMADKFKNDELKQEVLKRIPEGEVSSYKQGEFEDLCRGPHLPNTKFLRFFKLTRVAGAYLAGDENREMINRIYGTAYADKESLKEYIHIVEEAKKRDHRKLGVEMKLFAFDEEVGGGLALWLPNGGRLRSKLEQLLYKAHRERGYEPVRGPELLKSDVWKKSGHYSNYKENMYFTTIDDQEYGIKPMNCVGHLKVYQTEIRSYRDLPLKFFEYGVVHRHEKSGVLHGLFRVREFAQDDSHIFCMPSQIKQNILEILNFAGKIMDSFGFSYEMEISTKPTKAIGNDEIWDIATAALKEALDENGFKYGIDEGGGAFYGPKIDIKITDALKRKWQCGTIQVDFNLPERFDLGYIDSNNERQRPVMLHRALLGSFERFIGILIEHTAGELPFFIAPTQVVIIPISDAHLDYAKEVAKELRKINVDSEIANKNESLNKRIRTAEKQRVPMIVIIGDSEIENKSVALRDRHAREQKEMNLSDFISMLEAKLAEVKF